MRTIQNELGNGADQEINDLRQAAMDMKWDAAVAEVFETEVSKLERLNPSGPEYSIQYSYLETLLSLPWNEFTEDSIDIKKAQKSIKEWGG